MLPDSKSLDADYWIQRHFGAFRRMNPTIRQKAAVETWSRIIGQGRDPRGKVFFEVGTGRAPNVPLAYWLMGAEKTITIDLNPYMKEELARESVEYLQRHREEVEGLFGPFLDPGRFATLLDYFNKAPFELSAFLKLCGIHYIAPGDASNTPLPTGCVDYHTSYTVLEHIPPELVVRILQEGNRLVKRQGLFVHRIDYSDHFSHADRSISRINFLQYSESKWKHYAGNRFMYMNRLRHDDFLDLFRSSGHRILSIDTEVNREVLALLRGRRFRLDDRFKDKSVDVLSITGSWIVSEKYGP